MKHTHAIRKCERKPEVISESTGMMSECALVQVSSGQPMPIECPLSSQVLGQVLGIQRWPRKDLMEGWPHAFHIPSQGGAQDRGTSLVLG